jgi:GPH family glycoside/pentoside/hexuronide:cation symporter
VTAPIDRGGAQEFASKMNDQISDQPVAEHENADQEDDKPTKGFGLSKLQILAYAAPALPLSALSAPITVYLPPFYATEMGLGLTAVGAIFLISRVWDVVTDPLTGYVTDRVSTRFGRRRHWLAFSVPILMVCVVMVFMPKLVGVEQATRGYLLWWMIALYVGYTIAMLSQYSWAAELTGDYDERSRILSWREMGHLTGMFLVLGVAGVLEQFGDVLFDLQPGETSGVSNGVKVAAMGAFILILLPITTGLAIWRVPEREYHATKESLHWWVSVKLLLGNPLMRRVLGVSIMHGVPGNVMGALIVFYVSDILHAPRWISIIILSYYFFALISVPITVRISKRIGRHNALVICMLAMAAISPPFYFFGEGDLIPFMVLIGVSGLIFAGMAVLIRAITADVIDYDNLLAGEARTGLFYSLITMTDKLGFAVGVGTSYPLLEFMGYVPGALNSVEALNGLRFAYVFLPTLSMLFGAYLIYGFPLTQERQRDLRQQVEARDALRESGG